MCLWTSAPQNKVYESIKASPEKPGGAFFIILLGWAAISPVAQMKEKEAGGTATIICNNEKCEYRKDGKCSAEVMRYIDKLCQTFRRRIDARDMMQPDFRPRCHREKGKYVSDKGRLVK